MDEQSRTSIDLASLTRIAELAVEQVDGLEPDHAAVEVDADGSLRVLLRVHGQWGVPLQPAAARVRREVVRVTAAMTGLRVACVDVEVVGLVVVAPAPEPV